MTTIQEQQTQPVKTQPVEGILDMQTVTIRKFQSKRGLASAEGDVRDRVARSGGNAKHQIRGLQATDAATRSAIARKGGLARGAQRKEEARAAHERSPKNQE